MTIKSEGVTGRSSGFLVILELLDGVRRSENGFPRVKEGAAGLSRDTPQEGGFLGVRVEELTVFRVNRRPEGVCD